MHGDVHQSAVGGAWGPKRINLIKIKTLNLYGLLLLSRAGRAYDVGYFTRQQQQTQNANKKMLSKDKFIFSF